MLNTNTIWKSMTITQQNMVIPLKKLVLPSKANSLFEYTTAQGQATERKTCEGEIRIQIITIQIIWCHDWYLIYRIKCND